MKITITADGRKLAATTNGQPLTSGSVGIEAAFVLSADYDGLAVTAVFSAGETQIDVVLTNPNCIVPWEVLQEAKTTLFVGVVGKNGSGEIVIPTVWGRVGVIECGAVAEGLDPQDPTPDIAAQILQQARAALEEAEETKEAAAQSAESAAGSATDAAGSASDAAAAKAAAESAQAAAAGSANDAAGSATDAAAAKTAAESAQAAAEGSAANAAGSATDAAAAKADAEAAQTAAAGSANDAAGSASDAAAAKTAAESAQASAETARSAAAESASSAAGSSSIAAQQAQAAGSAKTAAEAAQEAAELAKNYAQAFTGAPRAAGSSAQMTDTSLIYVYTGTTSGALTNGHWYYWDGNAWADGGVYNSTAVQTDATLTVSGAPADAKATGDAVGDLKSAVNDPVTGLDSKAPVIIDTASGAIASFDDGADGMPLKALTVNIEPVQTGSGDPSPTNVRPISGWTGANVSRTGKNLLGISNMGSSVGQLSFAVESDGGIRVTGTAGSTTTYNLVNSNFQLTPSQQYLVNGMMDTVRLRLREYDSSNSVIHEYYATDNPTTFTVDANAVKFDATLLIRPTFSGNAKVYPMIRLSSDTDATFEPYVSTIISVSWQSEAGTVYGGTLDAANGVLTVDKAMWTKNTSTMNNSENYPGWSNSGIRSLIGDNINRAFTGQMLNIGTIFSVNTQLTNDTLFLSTGNYGKTQTEWIALAQDVQIIVSLATPLVYHLDPVTITTLLGQNNVWANCGPVSVKYPADTKLYIQKINTPTDDDMIADTQIASGKYFLIGNTLYLSTTVIPAGDTIIPGTNCTKTNLAAALNALTT